MNSRILELSTAVPATVVAALGTAADTMTHDIFTGQAIPGNRFALKMSSEVGAILAAHGGNITQSVGPAIAVVWVADQIRTYGKEKESEQIVKFANGFEFTGLLAICGANLVAESFKDWQYILPQNPEFWGDTGMGVGFMLIGVIATKGTIALYKKWKEDFPNLSVREQLKYYR